MAKGKGNDKAGEPKPKDLGKATKENKTDNRINRLNKDPGLSPQEKLRRLIEEDD